MRYSRITRRGLVMAMLLCLGVAVLWLWSASIPLVPSAAQGFATNTPVPTAQPFATNTAQPTATITPTVTATNTPPAPPAAPETNYALRLWLEQDYIDLLLSQLAALDTGGADARLAIRLTQYELRQRIPNAPRAAADRDALIRAALAAPRGAVEMRRLVRPAIQDALNNNLIIEDGTYNGFRIDLADANLDNRDMTDAVIRILYPADATTAEQVSYNEFIPALRGADGTYRLLETAYDLPAVPFGEINGVTLDRIEDVNRDGLDEMVLLVDDGQVNRRLFVVGLRNNQAADLTRPNEQIRFGAIVSWPVQGEGRTPPDLNVLNYQMVSALPDWPCISQQPVTWSYTNNLYRPSVDLNARYVKQDTLGCTLHEAEPLFDLAAAEAIDLIEAALRQYPNSAPGTDRALLTLAMFYVLEGQLGRAIEIGEGLLAETTEADTWAAQQARTLVDAASVRGNTALGICEALQFGADAPACDMDALLGRYLKDIPLRVEGDLLQQLDLFSLPVVETVRIEEIGRSPRTAIRFDIRNTGWWAFAQQRDGSYSVEAAEPPTGFEAATFPAGLTQAPETAYDALFVDNDPASAISLLETLERNNPNAELAPGARYLLALSYDLLGDRAGARSAYYGLWQSFPRSLWGELAARHLERR